MIRSRVLAALLFLGFTLAVPSSRAAEATWQSYNNEGMEAVQQRDYVTAELDFKNALKEAESFGPQDLRVAKTLINLGDLCGVNQYVQAENLYKRALAIEEKNFGTESPQLQVALEDLESTYYLEHKYVEAEPLLKRLLAIKEKSLSPSDAELIEARKEYEYALFRAQIASNPIMNSFVSMFPEDAVDGTANMVIYHPDLSMLLALCAIMSFLVFPGTIVWIVSRDAKRDRVVFYKRQVLLGIVAFVLALPVSIYFYQEGVKSEHWPTVEGTVTRGATVQHTFRHSQSINLQYEYAVNGRMYNGDQYKIGGNNIPKSDADVVAEYPEGKTVTVSYDPASPGTAVLIPGTNVQSWPIIIFFFSIPYTLLSLFGFSLAKRRRAMAV